MSDDSETHIDPRFDPVFQRGFDPSTSVDESVPAAAPPAAAPLAGVPRRAPSSVPVAAAGAPAPIAAPARIIPVQAPPPLPVSERSAPPVVQAELTPDDVVRLADSPEDIADDSSPTRNPFLLALGIIAVVLVAVGIWLFGQTGDAFNSSEVRSQGDYMTLVATIQVAPFIALLGGATAISVIFVFAARWRRHR
jgi:hypothetical protein